MEMKLGKSFSDVGMIDLVSIGLDAEIFKYPKDGFGPSLIIPNIMRIMDGPKSRKI